MLELRAYADRADPGAKEFLNAFAYTPKKL